VIALLAKGLLGMTPVVLYLVALVILDSYKLVKLRAVILAVAAGWAALVACHFINGFLLTVTGLDLPTFSRYIAPVAEETTKAAYLVFLIRTRRVGFMVDAVIFGFAIGAGFGILENIFYLRLIPDAAITTWVLRGCGTALMHGSTMAIFGVLAQRQFEAKKSGHLLHLLPPLLVAIVLHSFFNHFFLSPVLMSVLLVLGVPLITVLVYHRSERSLENWLGMGFDADAEMLEIINQGKVTDSRIGDYLTSLGDHFPPEVLLDMLCLLRVQVELAIEAKGILMLRKEGYDIQPGEELQDKITELNFLEKNIGPTARLALKPLRQTHRRDAWEARLLNQ
jgi:RsiW-degrading membrane proteinase PrsW (M82 family)